jgi:rhamnosyltransferase
MRSAGGVYFSRLDHVRACAAYLVFMWHFLHMTPQFPVPYASHPVFPFSFIDEGHTGVALFMTLSGYLFAKLVGHHDINFVNFFRSRAARLAPLLIVCLTAWWIIGRFTGEPVTLRDLAAGFVLPVWPKGAWSIAIELHFYLLFPLLLAAFRRIGPVALIAALAVALALRIDWWFTIGGVQHLSYWTIAGRIDQFVLGMLLAFVPLTRRVLSIAAAVSVAALLVFFDWFDRAGGYYHGDGTPSDSAVWIFLPTLEGAAYAALIAWYDRFGFAMPRWLDRALGKVGEWSYSIYLLHFFLIVLLRDWFAANVNDSGNFYLALLAGTATFIAFVPVAGLSYNYFEKIFLAWRKPYLVKPRIATAIQTAPVSATQL